MHWKEEYKSYLNHGDYRIIAQRVGLEHGTIRTFYSRNGVPGMSDGTVERVRQATLNLIIERHERTSTFLEKNGLLKEAA